MTYDIFNQIIQFVRVRSKVLMGGFLNFWMTYKSMDFISKWDFGVIELWNFEPKFWQKWCLPLFSYFGHNVLPLVLRIYWVLVEIVHEGYSDVMRILPYFLHQIYIQDDNLQSQQTFKDFLHFQPSLNRNYHWTWASFP